ncbi:hypothetical protein K488DRAFT_91664 [Vararia minispora EC-137]|uniref:Uncharacterized protein n=1 Tax=Vararia minispora EC-137 TaxID=1314806 RepID=A0ACB8Q566_9AGAM|nr:hypothetical protein K488DRAFT_91664 [Vararia minispora EC-137]
MSLLREERARWVPFEQVLKRLDLPQGSRLGAWEPHPLAGRGRAGSARTSNMAIDERILRECLQYLLSLCHAKNALDWAVWFREVVDAWVYDYAFNAHVILTVHARPDHTGEVPFLPEEREAWFYACRRAMAGLSEELDLICRDSIDEDAFRRAFEELRPFRRSQRLRRAAARLGIDCAPPSDPVSLALRQMYPPPTTAEEAIHARNFTDSWEMDWRSDDFECDYALPDDRSEASTSSEDSGLFQPSM